MASSLHSDDSHSAGRNPKSKGPSVHKSGIKHERSLHEISDSEEDELWTNVHSSRKRKRSSSWDSDRTIDPDEEPELFKNKSMKKQRSERLSDSDDSDMTVDLSPELVTLSDHADGDSQINKYQNHLKHKTESYNSTGPKSFCQNPPTSDIKSESGSTSKGSTASHASPSKVKKKINTSVADDVRTSAGQTRHHPSKMTPKNNPKSIDKPGGKHPTTTGKTPGYLKKKDISDSEDSDATVDLEEETEVQRSNKRPMCRYGSKCYRKNPSHLEEYRHPPKECDQPGPSKPPSAQRAAPNPLQKRPSNTSSRRPQTAGCSPTPARGTTTAQATLAARGTTSARGTSADQSTKAVHSTTTEPGTMPGRSTMPARGTMAELGTTPGRSNTPGRGTKADRGIKAVQGTTAGPGTTTGPGRADSTDVPTVVYDPISPAEALAHAGPLGFFLTKVIGIKATHNNRLAMHIKDILSSSMGNLEKSAQFNYMTDIGWLVAQYPLQFRAKPLLVVHGCQRREKAALEKEASVYSHIQLCQARLEIVYGTHHTKMMLLVYDNGMRVVIHTSNLIQQDWHQKTQGIWISPLFPKLPTESATAGESETFFKRDLLEYINAYKARPLEDWTKTIRQHDMSNAKVYIIGSVPGRHTGEKKSAFGHLKLRKLLQQHGPTPLHVNNWPVLGQFSSVGSLGPNKENWVCGEWLTSLSTARGCTAALGTAAAKLKLVYPSKDNVRLSLEGYPAGGSLPYSMNTAKKQSWLHHFFHQWKSVYRGRSQASPHIKTYLRASPDWLNIAWFIVTSANLSKAAWGALEKNGQQLMIRSYELGVLFLPDKFGTISSFRRMKDISESLTPIPGKQLVFPVPYDLPPTEYSQQDRPWVWDIPYVDKPDTNGNMWCPQ